MMIDTKACLVIGHEGYMWPKTIFLLQIFMLSGCGRNGKQYLAELLAFSIIGASLYVVSILISFFFPQHAEDESEHDENES
jgi:hypothetical protein